MNKKRELAYCVILLTSKSHVIRQRNEVEINCVLTAANDVKMVIDFDVRTVRSVSL